MGIDTKFLGIFMGVFAAMRMITTTLTGKYILKYISRINAMVIGVNIMILYVFAMSFMGFLTSKNTITASVITL